MPNRDDLAKVMEAMKRQQGPGRDPGQEGPQYPPEIEEKLEKYRNWQRAEGEVTQVALKILKAYVSAARRTGDPRPIVDTCFAISLAFLEHRDARLNAAIEKAVPLRKEIEAMVEKLREESEAKMNEPEPPMGTGMPVEDDELPESGMEIAALAEQELENEPEDLQARATVAAEKLGQVMQAEAEAVSLVEPEDPGEEPPEGRPLLKANVGPTAPNPLHPVDESAPEKRVFVLNDEELATVQQLDQQGDKHAVNLFWVDLGSHLGFQPMSVERHPTMEDARYFMAEKL